MCGVNTGERNYNIPSNNRELQQYPISLVISHNYNIPSNNRELQLFATLCLDREIITYQVITGNYSFLSFVYRQEIIITYQVITGNYSTLTANLPQIVIITYQVITGNYSR